MSSDGDAEPEAEAVAETAAELVEDWSDIGESTLVLYPGELQDATDRDHQPRDLPLEEVQTYYLYRIAALEAKRERRAEDIRYNLEAIGSVLGPALVVYGALKLFDDMIGL